MPTSAQPFSSQPYVGVPLWKDYPKVTPKDVPPHTQKFTWQQWGQSVGLEVSSGVHTIKIRKRLFHLGESLILC